MRALRATAVDRDTALVLAKCVIAGTVAWTLATEAFHATHATFAAFTAMLLMHQTIAESVEKALHYTAAVLLGIGLVGAAVLPRGVQSWLLPIILGVTLVIGRWHRLGSQGFEVTVAAVFAYGLFAAPTAGKQPLVLLRDLAAMVVLGAVVAVITNLVIAPPLRYRSASGAVEGYFHAVTELLGDAAEGLRSGVPDEDATREWRRRSEDLPTTAAQTRSTIDHAWETNKLNPRRLLNRNRSTLNVYRVTVHGVDRIAEQFRFVTAGLFRVARDRERGQDLQELPRNAFHRYYSDVLSATRGAVDTAAKIHSVADLHAGDPLADASDHCRRALRRLGATADNHHLDLPDDWALYGALYTDAERLCDEVESLRQALRDAVPRHR
jgi:Aromatic acid exporter family member 1